MVPPGSFHPSLKTRWGFVSIRCLGPALHPEAELEACRFQTSLHFSPEGRHAGACVFADRHASSRSVRLGACTLSWVLGLGRLASWQAAWEAGPSAPVATPDLSASSLSWLGAGPGVPGLLQEQDGERDTMFFSSLCPGGRRQLGTGYQPPHTSLTLVSHTPSPGPFLQRAADHWTQGPGSWWGGWSRGMPAWPRNVFTSPLAERKPSKAPAGFLPIQTSRTFCLLPRLATWF